MKTKMRRLINILFSLAFMLGLVQGLSMTALAATTYKDRQSLSVSQLETGDIVENSVLEVTGIGGYAITLLANRYYCISDDEYMAVSIGKDALFFTGYDTTLWERGDINNYMGPYFPGGNANAWKVEYVSHETKEIKLGGCVSGSTEQTSIPIGTAWKIGDTINLNGGWFVYGRYVIQRSKEGGSGIVQALETQGVFAEFKVDLPVDKVVDYDKNQVSAPEGATSPIEVDIKDKPGKTPIGFKLASGTGTVDNPYRFEALWPDVEKVTISETSLSTLVDPNSATTILIATVNPDNAGNPELKWESSNPAVVEARGNSNNSNAYDNLCYLRALSAGTATITVRATNGTDDKSDDKTATCTVKVYDPYKIGTVWRLGDTINLHGAWYLDQKGASYQYRSKDVNGRIPANPQMRTNIAEFSAVIPMSEYFPVGGGESKKTNSIGSLKLSIPSDKKGETPIGIRLVKGKGIVVSPYEFELVYKAVPTVTAPKARTLTYNGKAQTLVTAGTTSGGTMQYALGKDKTTAPAASAYTASIPAKTDAGTYYVWYKVKGNDDYSDSSPACVIATIARKNDSPTKSPESKQPVKEKEKEKENSSKKKAEKKADESTQLNMQLRLSWKGSNVVFKWGKASGADSYEIYMAYCGDKPLKKVKTVGNVNMAVFKKLDGKKLNRRRCVRGYVIAYRNGTKIGRSLVCHAAGPNSVFTNAKKVKTSKKTYKLKVGKTAKLKAKTVKRKGSKRLLSNEHCARLRYASSDTSVATVSKSGKIKAVGTGKCSVWVYAQNGVSKKVTVIVK